jgi:hypothetical protein
VLDCDDYGGVWTSNNACPLASGVPVAFEFANLDIGLSAHVNMLC